MDHFHHLIKKWFLEKYMSPTETQIKAWKLISENKHTLISSPTGTGKTLAAFLYALNNLFCGLWTSGSLQVLYISPLKALNNDISENLQTPLNELKEIFSKYGETVPLIRTAIRSGDTSQLDRRRINKTPPEILITTPESLNIMLTSKKNRAIFSTVKQVIIDEIHSIAGNHRGIHCLTAVDRLPSISGEFQRIALSATINPIQEVAKMAAGFQYKNNKYSARPIAIADSSQNKKLSVNISFIPFDINKQQGYWEYMAAELLKYINKSVTTLIFTNSRRLSERLAYLINEEAGSLIVYAHHGSLSQSIREAVERKMRDRELKAIIATSTLEMGIDIGHIEQVLLVQTPVSISSAIQRIGRSGHSVGETSTGTLFPSSGIDLLTSAVTAEMVKQGKIEKIIPLKNQLDLLPQLILSEVISGNSSPQNIYTLLRCSYAYNSLKEDDYYSILEMMEGKIKGKRIKELYPKLYFDHENELLSPLPNSALTLYSSGGTITDRGYYTLKHAEYDSKIGELDEEFVWERRIGDTFGFGNAQWKITAIDHQNVKVIPYHGSMNSLPFWKAEPVNRDYIFSKEIGELLKYWNKNQSIPEHLPLDPKARKKLISFLQLQQSKINSKLPDTNNIIIEYTKDPNAKNDLNYCIIHTFWGNRVNYPISLGLKYILLKRGINIDIVTDNNSLLLITLEELSILKLFKELFITDIYSGINKFFGTSGFFGSRFREHALRALLLPSRGFNKRIPLWMNRMRSKKLFSSLSGNKEFPIMKNTWKYCLDYEFDLINADQIITSLNEGIISLHEVYTDTPSPFTSNLLWQHVNEQMYGNDTPESAPQIDSAILINEIIRGNSNYRKPDLSDEKEFHKKLQNRCSEYSPTNLIKLFQLIKDRVFIFQDEMEDYCTFMELTVDEFIVLDEIVQFTVSQNNTKLIIHIDNYYDVFHLLSDLKVTFISDKCSKKTAPGDYDSSGIFKQYLSYFGACSIKILCEKLSIDKKYITTLIKDDDNFITGEILSGEGIYTADIEVYEKLLRYSARLRRYVVQPREINDLCFYIAWNQLLLSSTNQLADVIDLLFAYPLHYELIEKDIFHSRLQDYSKPQLDTFLSTTDLEWYGVNDNKAAFRLKSDRDLFYGIRSCVLEDKSLLAASFTNLQLEQKGIHETELKKYLWDDTLSCNSFYPLRVKEKENQSGKTSRPGNWNKIVIDNSLYSFISEKKNTDSLEQFENSKDIIKMLIQRYGILCRVLMKHESRSIKWSQLLRALQSMELSGELICGTFFKGISGNQYMTPEVFVKFKKLIIKKNWYWMNAADPASLAGISIEHYRNILPHRKSNTKLLFRGSFVAAVFYSNLSEIDIHIDQNDVEFEKIFEYYNYFLNLNGRYKITIKKINGENPENSFYLKRFKENGFIVRNNKLILEKQF